MAKYTEKSIHIPGSEVEKVRLKPAFYLGTEPGSNGLFQICKEPLDNGIDELMNLKRSKSHQVGWAMDKEGYFYVWDTGRGIPVGLTKTSAGAKISTLTAVLTILHAGGKLKKEQTGYAKSVGTHGVGVTVTNALSEHLEINTFRDGRWWRQEFKRGKPITKVEKIKDKNRIKIPKVKAPENGTVLRFKPDTEIFKKAKIKPEAVKDWLKTQSYIQSGLTFIYVSPKTGKIKKYYRKEGLKDFVAERIKTLEVEADGKPFILQNDKVDVALQWCGYDEEALNSYVNGSPTAAGGKHVDGLAKAIAEVLRHHTKKKDGKLTSAMYRSGMVGALNVYISVPQFDNQLKDKLVSKEAVDTVYNAVLNPLKEFFSANKKLARRIVERAATLQKIQAEAKSNSKLAAATAKKAGKRIFPPVLKYAAPKHYDPNKNEVFIVEGDSAKGTATMARDKTYMGVLALRGKLPNAIRAKNRDKINNNEEVAYIFQVIGWDLKVAAANPQKALNNILVRRVIILADPDPDGAHINSLVLSVLFKYAPELIKAGKVYLVDGGLFTGKFRGRNYFGATRSILAKKLKPGQKFDSQTRLKGWGEANVDQLDDVAINPATRTLIKVKWPKDKKEVSRFVKIMDEDTFTRKQMLGIAT